MDFSKRESKEGYQSDRQYVGQGPQNILLMSKKLDFQKSKLQELTFENLLPKVINLSTPL